MSTGSVVVEIGANVRPALRAVGRAGIRIERQETTADGFAARTYVRGGADPAYADPDSAMFYAHNLIAAGEPAAAASFLRGWATRIPDEPGAPPAAWHRLIGTTAVSVGGAA